MSDRRRFLKTTTAVVSAASLGACSPGTESAGERDTETGHLPDGPLAAVAEAVLPAELGADGRARAVEAFQRWLVDYQPVPELNHGYGTPEIRYGPADPAPGWRAQLEALDLEAEQRAGVRFAELAPADRVELLILHVETAEPGSGLPSPLYARHVAVALMAHWFRSPEATDRCYGVAIERLSCRGIESASAEPGPQGEAG